MHGDHHGDHAHHHDHHLTFDTPEMAAHAELEGEVLVGFVAQGAEVLAGLAQGHGVDLRRLLDLGCGPGVGTCCLAERFPAAQVVAVDGSAAMLERVTARADRLGLAERVEPRLVDLSGDLTPLGRADAAWASMALHHVGDEVAALRRVRELLEPDGLLALVERAAPTRLLPDGVDLGRPGLWERLDAAWTLWFDDMRAELPGATASGDYVALLGDAGFDVEADRVLTVVLDAPLDEATGRLVLQHVQRMQGQLVGYADAADLAALDELADERADGSILRRDDAVLRASRHLYVGRARSGT